MSSRRSRVAALTLLCALALASRADATGAQPSPARVPESPAMTIEQAAALLDAPPPPATAPPQSAAPDPALVPRAAAIRAGSSEAALYGVWSERAADQLARVEPYVPRFLLDGFDELQHGELTPDALCAAGAVALLLVLLGALARAVRGSGAIAVTIDYPIGLRGTFY